MGFFTRTAMDALMKTTHPEINRRQCWNLHPHRKPCTTCKDICPYGEEIFSRPNLVKDWDPCTDCGLCVSACRSGCIAPSPEQVQRDTAAADSDSDTIWIGCERSPRKNTVVRSCICALSWEALAYLALNKKIVLDLTPCGQCENDLCAEQLRKELTRLVDFFGQPMFEARFSLAYEEKEYPYHVQELTRREMLEQVSHGSKSGTKKLLQMLPGLRSEEDSGVDFRLLLHQRTKQLKAAMETPLQYGYYMPKFTDNCFGCGRCEKACRANAMKFEDMPNGQTRMVLTPWKCSECGVCMNVCSNKGFDGMKLYQLTTLGPVVLHKCTKTLCKQCGKPIAPDSAEGLCSVCRIKARTQKRQEEARLRAEQLKAERAAKAAEDAAKAAENTVEPAAEAAAQAQNEKAIKGAREEQIQAAYEMWQKAQAGVTIAEKSYKRVKNLYEQGVMPAQKLDEVTAQRDAAIATEKAAKAQYTMAKNGAEREDKMAAEALVNRAKGAVAEVESYIKETYLIAPAAGEVSEIFPKVGELVGTGAPIMNIAELNDMWVTFNVREDLLKNLTMGAEFEAVVPALDNKTVRLKVYYLKDLGTYAAWKATKTTGQFDLKTFEVKASPMEKVENLRPGMSVIINK